MARCYFSFEDIPCAGETFRVLMVKEGHSKWVYCCRRHASWETLLNQGDIRLEITSVSGKKASQDSPRVGLKPELERVSRARSG